MTTPIRAGLDKTSRLRPLVKDGIRALARAHRALIEKDIRPEFADSLDIDKAFQAGHEQQHRWDYLLGHEKSRKIVGLEPHTANNKEVSTVIKKRETSRCHLRAHLKEGVIVTDWFWVASGRIDFMPMEKAITKLNENGIHFVGKKVFKRRLTEMTGLATRSRRAARTAPK